jgi:peptidoglycan/LPS O-acetylase OafA/YrhL
MKKNKNWINGMDSLRFILALIVLLSHLDNPYVKVLKNSETAVGKYTAAILANSFNGIGAVIAFFIISGFVVHYPVKDAELNIRKFLIRRWIRIGVPLVILSSIAMYYDQFALIPIWSLYCELIYYTIYPILRKIKLSWLVKCQIAYFIQIILVILFCQNDILSFIYQKDVDYFGTYWQLGDFMTWIIGLPIWLLGVLVAENIDGVSVKIKDITFKELSIYRISIFVLGVTLHVLKFHFFLSDIIILNVFALLMVKWIEREIVFYKTHKSIEILEFGGQFSYSLYLCHGMCVLFLSNFMALNIYTYPIYILLSLLVSYVVYLVIEKPSHKMAQKLASLQFAHKSTA